MILMQDLAQKKKTYCYKIYNKTCNSPLNSKDTWWVSKKLDINNMSKAALFLLGNHDFSSFRSSGCQASSPVKTLDKVSIIKKKNIIILKFTARSFLYNQVRIMTGTLKDVGSGLITPDKFKKILMKKNRTLAGVTAPSKGLTLEKVTY